VHDSLNDLLDDVIVHIMQFLDTREIITASMVSKRFALLGTNNLLKMSNKLYSEALRYLNREQYNGALKVFNTALRMFPRDYKCWRKRSDCWVDFEPGTSWKFPGLHTYSDLITALQVCDNECFRNLIISDIYCLSNEYDKSLEYIDKALELEPNNLTCLHQRGFILGTRAHGVDQDRTFEINDYLKILEFPYDKDFMIHHNLAYCYFLREQDDLSLEHHKKSVEICPDFTKSFVNRGLLHCHRGENELGKQCLEIAMKINPSFYESYSLAASFAVLEEDFSNAFVMLTKGFELCNHKDSILLNNLLVMFDNAGRLEDIVTLCSKLIQEYSAIIFEAKAKKDEITKELAGPCANPIEEPFRHIKLVNINNYINNHEELFNMALIKKIESLIVLGRFEEARTTFSLLSDPAKCGFGQALLKLDVSKISSEVLKEVKDMMQKPLFIFSQGPEWMYKLSSQEIIQTWEDFTFFVYCIRKKIMFVDPFQSPSFKPDVVSSLDTFIENQKKTNEIVSTPVVLCMSFINLMADMAVQEDDQEE
jgi:tetratricopeptide (TPR) repeat protein